MEPGGTLFLNTVGMTHDLVNIIFLFEFWSWWRESWLNELSLQFRGWPCDFHISSLVTMTQEVIVFLTVPYQNVQWTSVRFNFELFHKHLRHSACTQFLLLFFRNIFMNVKLVESDLIMNCLFSLTFSSTPCTKSLFSKDGYLLYSSSDAS